MCTLTYVPVSGGAIVTTNRDESPKRNANALSTYLNFSQSPFLIAKEPLYGGTNIAISQEPNPMVVVLLNGAFHAHKFGLKYRMSRGLMVLESLNYATLSAFEAFGFEGVEPFTMVRIGTQIEEVRWDGKQMYYTNKDVSKPHIWSSAQLYSPAIIRARETWFETWLRNKPLTAETMADFHHNGGIGDLANDLVMNRQEMVKTVSISQSAWTGHSNQVHHWNLENNQESSYIFSKQD